MGDYYCPTYTSSTSSTNWPTPPPVILYDSGIRPTTIDEFIKGVMFGQTRIFDGAMTFTGTATWISLRSAN